MIDVQMGDGLQLSEMSGRKKETFKSEDEGLHIGS